MYYSSFFGLEKASLANFIVNDGEAYTEDFVKVYNICVRIPKKFQLTDEQVATYFSQFGAVRSVNLQIPEDMEYTNASVSFVEASGAAYALRPGQCSPVGSCIVVKAADSWDQPYTDEACDFDDSSSIESMSQEAQINGANKTTVLSLNDDCFDHICEYLSLRDQIHFARACRRFYEVFRMYGIRKYKFFPLNAVDLMTLWETRDFFRFIGSDIEKLTGTFPQNYRKRVVDFIRANCTQLKILSLNHIEMASEEKLISKLLSSLHNLEELRLQKCLLFDDSTRTLLQLPKLKILEISHSETLTGRHLYNLQQLENLDLHSCSNIGASQFVDICTSLHRLKSLDFRYCKGLTAAAFEALVASCPPLEVLRISCLEGTQPLAKADRNRYITDAILKLLCTFKNLREISINYCLKITHEGILELLGSCSNLCVVNIQFCGRISAQLISMAIQLIKQRNTLEAPAPVIFLVYGTSITKRGLSVMPEYNSAMKSSLIDVNFEVPALDDVFSSSDFVESAAALQTQKILKS